MTETYEAELISRIGWLLTMAVTAAFTMAIVYLNEGVESATAFGAFMALAFLAFSLLGFFEHALKFFEGFRGALSRVVPNRWLGMEVDND